MFGGNGNMISMADYEGFGNFVGGFGTSSQDVNDLNKALSVGYSNPRTSGADALRVESLESTMRILTYNANHIRIWKDIDKRPAYSTVEEYNVQLEYGGEAGIFTRDGELAQTADAAYERKAQFVKFLGVQKEVSHVTTLVKPAHGNIIAMETVNGTMHLMAQLERALFNGRSDIIPESFAGIYQQITSDSVAWTNNVIDLRGGILTQEAIEVAVNTVIENFGIPSDVYLANQALSDIAKQFYPYERFNYPFPTNGKVGMSINQFQTQGGVVNLKGDIFLRSARMNGTRNAPTAASSPRAPTAPTISLGAAGSAAPLFDTEAEGTYRYRVTAINRFGESAASASSSQAVLANQTVTITVTDGGGSDTATGYRVYRSKVGGAANTEQIIMEIARTPGAATTAISDVNQFLPGTSKAFMVQLDPQVLAFKQLAPMMKIALATLNPAIRWTQLMYGTPIVYAPRKCIIFINVKDQN